MGEKIKGKNIGGCNVLCRGSVTIELALLMPMILSVFILLIYSSFFLYNRETIEMIACVGLHRGLQMEHEGKAAIQKEVETYVEESLEKKLLFHPKVTNQVKVSLTSISVTIEIEQEIPFGKLPALTQRQNLFSAKASKKGNRINPADILWLSAEGVGE